VPPLLARAETIESAYEVWQELREHHTAAQARLSDEQRKLDSQGEFLLGTVRAARSESSDGALSKPEELDAYLARATAQLEQARKELATVAGTSADKWSEAFKTVRDEVRARVERMLDYKRPRVRLKVRTLADDKRILHVDRPGADEAVLLCVVFTGKLPTRYGYLFDDSVLDMREAPPSLYAEEGVLPAHVRPDARALEALVAAEGEALPFKAMVPLRLSGMFVRLVERGPIMEAEIADGAQFRNILTRDQAERIAGHLLKLKLEGRIELDIGAE
jgi:hypothetical protein